MGFQIAIDGPGGTGKSTTARLAAQKLGFTYIDTGAMYRAVGVFALEKGVDVNDAEAVEALLPMIEIGINRDENGGQRVSLNGVDVTEQLRTAEAGEAASCVSVHGAVRTKLVELQRQLATDSNVIMDGRDIGSFVLPDANVKIYMDASAEIRAKRRVAELLSLNQPADFETVKSEIEKRDYRDKNREITPLVMVEGAVLIDTGDLTIDEVVELIVNAYNA